MMFSCLESFKTCTDFQTSKQTLRPWHDRRQKHVAADCLGPTSPNCLRPSDATQVRASRITSTASNTQIFISSWYLSMFSSLSFKNRQKSSQCLFSALQEFHSFTSRLDTFGTTFADLLLAQRSHSNCNLSEGRRKREPRHIIDTHDDTNTCFTCSYHIFITKIERSCVLCSMHLSIYNQIKIKHIPRHGMNFVVLFLRLTDTVHLDIAKLVSPFLFRSQNHTSKQHQKIKKQSWKQTLSSGNSWLLCSRQ